MYEKETFIEGLPEAMSCIATSPELHNQMGTEDLPDMTTDYSQLDRIMANFNKTLQRCNTISTSTKKVGVFAKTIDSIKLGKNFGSKTHPKPL